MLNTLSGRFLILTTILVVLAEVFILAPSLARYRENYLLSRLERAQIASLAVEASDALDPGLEQELLENAGVFNVVLRRDEVRQLALSSPIPEPLFATYDLREETGLSLIREAIELLADPENRVIRVIGDPVRQGGLLIEVTMETGPLRREMIEYGLRILAVSAAISGITATLLFLAVQRFMVRPIRRLVGQMRHYTVEPEDTRRIIEPRATLRELHEAETTLQLLETQLTNALKQKGRLAQLGGAVAKVSHDLRNILTSAQLFADRIEGVDDPTVARLAPKLVGSITRAVSLCESVLAFGRAEEPPPNLTRFALARLVSDVLDAERLAAGEEAISFSEDVPSGLVIRADQEQLYRVLSNLVRNARQALSATGEEGEVSVSGTECEDHWRIAVTDTGPGMPPRARENLFQAFSGGVAKGGSGLGLAIAAELVRGHGGRLDLAGSGPEGTCFVIWLPRGDATVAAAPQGAMIEAQ
ncbi:sensor histidine kinase [Pseudoroseicyclus aestuarii]|uniref:histidine kinase n=1 Tax=Pseudoroseicyclus aestuarii TaxID=1795041 RepID=A0A318SQV0_9RHOB|nr:HAMP domain-containing sensor histidine kinase [Pseudoroseicyclus aestuarii]PYE83775.1 hypothetical protein DFP88_103134 [Pseudoroseicyclus aestuarii]